MANFQNSDLRQFLGGQDFDSENKSVGENMYRLLVNGRNGPRKKGVIVNVQGNILIPNAGLPTTGKNLCKGGYEDITSDSFIFFNENSEGYHGIYQYFLNKPGYQNGVIETIVRIERPWEYTFDNPNPLGFIEQGYITSINLVDNSLLYWSDPSGYPKKLDLRKARETGKKRKFNICFNKSNFTSAVKYTLNVYEFSNPTPVATMIWNSGGNDYYQRCKEFESAYNAAGLASLFSIDNCGQFVQIEMNHVGKYFVSISEVTLVSKDVKVDGYFNINSYLIRSANAINLAPFDQVILYGLAQLPQLNGLTQTIMSVPTLTSAIFNSPSIGIDVSGDTGKMMYLPEQVANATPSQSMVIPENFYGDYDAGIEAAGIKTYDTLRYDLFDRLKYPPQCNPTCQYKTDDKREINLVKNSVFQFRAKYIYDNYENSVYGGISNIAIVGISCDDSKNFGDTNNCIDVDFMDERFNNASAVSIIKKVVLAVREHNNGEWREIKTFEQYEFAGVGQSIYRFYNDNIYTAIAAEEVNKPYDSIGKKVLASEYVDDRLFDGGITEGYDQPCIDAKVNVDYQAAPVEQKYTIRGRLYIRNAFFTVGGAFGEQQPIWVSKGANGRLCFGGIGRDLGLNEEWLTADQMIDRYKQDIPLGGFVFYLAGTDYYGITKQHQTGPMGGKGWYQGGSRSKRDLIRSEINAGNVFHDFEITGVPPGRYVIRIASHHTTQDDLNSPGRAYQKTSTFAMNVAGSGDFEQIIDVINTDVDLGLTNSQYSEIADLSSPLNFISAFNADPIPNGIASENFSGYLVDHDLGVITPNYLEYLNDTRIERATIKSNTSMSFANQMLGFLLSAGGAAAGIWNSLNADHKCLTDHNGFFWIGHLVGLGTHIDISEVQSGWRQSTSYTKLGQDNTSWGGRTAYGMSEIAVRNEDDVISDDCRTYITGIAARTGSFPFEGIFGASVVNTHGTVGSTDVDGNFRVHTYCDTTRVNGWNPPTGNFRIDKIIVFEGSALCKTDPSFISQDYTLLIENVTTGSPPQYDADNTYDMGLFFFAVLLSATSICAEKRGSDIVYGIAYYDEGDRRCAIITSPELKKHILFYTEKNPDTGNMEQFGLPVISWEIYNEPPKWAVKYRWCRTANLQLNNWLQWGVNRALYVTKDNTDLAAPTTFELGDFCVIDLQSIGYYSIIDHPDAVINFTFVAGDRIRFIADENGNFFTKYLDYEIVRILGNNFVYIYKDNTFEIKANYRFEIYSPRNQSQVNNFYEFGECFDVKTAVINGIRKKYHTGPDQDQTYGTLPAMAVTPAKGVFKTGSAYYRRRKISTGCTLPNVNPPVNPTNLGSMIISVDDPSISDFYQSNDYSIGRVLSSAEVPGEIHRGSAVRFSGRYVQNSKVNNLSSFDALNEKQFSNSFGDIIRLVLRDNTVLVAVFSNSYTVNMYINQGILRQAQGTGLIAISDDVIPRTQISQRTFGSVNPESIYLNDQADLFGWDEKQGVPWRMSGNGMIQLSDYYANNYFKPKGMDRIVRDRLKSRTPAVYDLNFDEYILTFNNLPYADSIAPKATISLPNFDTTNPAGMKIKITFLPLNILLCQFTVYGTGVTGALVSTYINLFAASTGNGFSASVDQDGNVIVTAPNNASLYGNGSLLIEIQGADPMTSKFDAGQIGFVGKNEPADTIVFIKEKNFWPQKYEFFPEYYGRIRNEIMSFVDGQLWLHHRNPLYNNFYGVQHTRKLTVVTNSDWEKVKNYLSISESAENINWCPDIRIEPGPNSPIGMRSRIQKTSFKTQQNKQWANFKRDLNTPGKLNQIDALNTGRPLIGQSMVIILEDDSVTESPIMSANINYFWSELS